MCTKHNNSNDTVGLNIIELLCLLWRHKLQISMTAAVFCVLAAAYAFLATPVYQARIFLDLPSQNDISQLNQGRGRDAGLPMVTVESAFRTYARVLQSEALRREFFRSVYLPSVHYQQGGSLDRQYLDFGKKLVVADLAPQSGSRFVVLASSSDPQLAAKWVARYAEMAGVKAREGLVRDLAGDVEVRVGQIESQIGRARDSAVKRREDKVAQLKDALVVAKSIGLERSTAPQFKQEEGAPALDNSLAYLRGSRALEAEIRMLENRVSDDPYVKGLREEQEELSFYRGIKIDHDSVSLYRQDGVVEVPDTPIKPTKMLIILIGGLLGVVVGVMLVFVRRLF